MGFPAASDKYIRLCISQSDDRRPLERGVPLRKDGLAICLPDTGDSDRLEGRDQDFSYPGPFFMDWKLPKLVHVALHEIFGRHALTRGMINYFISFETNGPRLV